MLFRKSGLKGKIFLVVALFSLIVNFYAVAVASTGHDIDIEAPQDRKKQGGVSYAGLDFIDSLKLIEPSLAPNSKKSFGYWASATFLLGHHEDFTQAKSWSQTKLKTSGFYFGMGGEAGLVYKITRGSLFFGYMVPVPPSPVKDGYKNRTGILSGGLSAAFQLLPRSWKVNLSTIGGHKWIYEPGDIFDPTGAKPELLDARYYDYGVFFGTVSRFSLFRETEVGIDLSVEFEYIREELRVKANKFRIGFVIAGGSHFKGSLSKEKDKGDGEVDCRSKIL